MVYRSLLRPLLFRLPPETAHHLALRSLSLTRPFKSLVSFNVDESMAVNRFGLHFSHPVGLAAGFDKNGIALRELASLGFSHIEAGTVTYHAQPGNPLPRLFRLPKDQALINRAGFNNDGADAFTERARGNKPRCVLGVSIGKSKVTPLESAVDDYLKSFESVYSVADYVAINVSSPNTPQLRQLQQVDQLSYLLKDLKNRNHVLQTLHSRSRPIPLLVKLSPDLSNEEVEGIVAVLGDQQVDGIIATNTTITRNNLNSSVEEVRACGDGGLSGKPLRNKSTELVRDIYKLSKGRIPIIGVGGVFTATDAWEKIAAGASLVQLYTGFIYEGPLVARRIVTGLKQLMIREGFHRLEDAIGHGNPL